MNCLIEQLYPVTGDTRAAGVGIENNRVPGRQHGDGITGQGRQRVSDRSDGADDAEGGVFRECESIFSAAGVGAQKLDSGSSFTGYDQFLNLMLEPADLGLLHFFLAE